MNSPDPQEPRTESAGADDVPVEQAAEPTPEERVQELEDRLKRLQADFVNETKRIKSGADQRITLANEKLVLDLLPVFDALHSAREGFENMVREAGDDAGATERAALEGFDLVERELLNVLSRHGVERIEAIGAAFDHALHHAIVMVDRPDLEPGTVAMELRPGFTLSGKVVRPAHVAVARPPEEPAPAGE